MRQFYKHFFFALRRQIFRMVIFSDQATGYEKSSAVERFYVAQRMKSLKIGSPDYKNNPGLR